jgi:hypothetical protein
MVAQQGGQALAEALVILVVLGSLWVGIAWLGRLQDVGLQLAHASRRAAFAHAHQGLPPQALEPGGDGYLDAAGQRWRTRQGQDFLAGAVHLRLRSMGVLHGPQPGDPVTGASAMRQELQLGDPAIWRAEVGVETAGSIATRGTLPDFDRLGLGLRRHTAILSGDGAAAGDGEAQSTLASSPHAWGNAATASRTAGEHILARLRGVDVAWGRALPDWDWIHAWTGSVPDSHVQPWSRP